MSYHRIGQLDSLIASAGAVVGMGIQTGTTAYLTKKQLDAQRDMAAERGAVDTELAQIQANEQQKLLAFQYRQSADQQQTIKSVAIMAIVGLGLTAVLITAGVMMVSGKKGNRR
jgi:hypothetical protein